MARYRSRLPQLGSKMFLTDGGLETTLIFIDKQDLPHFAAFALLRDEVGRQTLKRYFYPYLTLARSVGAGFILESPTWRGNRDWGAKLGYSVQQLAAMNRAGIALMEEVRTSFETSATPIIISGCIGPRGDGYVAGEEMSPDEAQAYHAEQIAVFADTAADLVSAFTLTNINEAIGIARAAAAHHMPVVLSFTLEIDGRLPSGAPLRDAIKAVDAATDAAPAYYMINCAHPTHFSGVLEDGGGWTSRLRGIRANASRRSHAELDNSSDLDDGDPVELAAQYCDLRRRFPQLTVLGGCCGTDYRHVERIGTAPC